jgi:alpha-ribazole phosphatase CobZ
MRYTLFEWAEAEVSSEAVIIKSTKELKVLSSAVINGGMARANTIVNLKVPLDFDHEATEYFSLKGAQLGVEQGAVCLMTAADVEKAVVKTDSKGEIGIAVIATSDTLNSTDIADGMGCSPGTINTMVIVNRHLTDGCLANAIMSASEAKCKALASMDIRSKFSDRGATGTSSDAILIACPADEEGEGENTLSYAGSATDLGFLIGKNVCDALKGATVELKGPFPHRAFETPPHRPLVERLAERGILVEDMRAAAMELFTPHPGVSNERAGEIFLKCLREAMSDINVSSLVMAAMRMNEDGSRGLLPGLPKEVFDTDPVHLVADEILGISIAIHIAGYYGLFEFYRFDNKKPGLLGRLPPFEDDAIGGLLAGASSRMYSELFKRSD